MSEVRETRRRAIKTRTARDTGRGFDRSGLGLAGARPEIEKHIRSLPAFPYYADKPVQTAGGQLVFMIGAGSLGNDPLA